MEEEEGDSVGVTVMEEGNLKKVESLEEEKNSDVSVSVNVTSGEGVLDGVIS